MYSFRRLTGATSVDCVEYGLKDHSASSARVEGCMHGSACRGAADQSTLKDQLLVDRDSAGHVMRTVEVCIDHNVVSLMEVLASGQKGKIK